MQREVNGPTSLSSHFTVMGWGKFSLPAQGGGFKSARVLTYAFLSFNTGTVQKCKYGVNLKNSGTASVSSTLFHACSIPESQLEGSGQGHHC